MTTVLAVLGVVAAGLSAWAATKSARAAEAVNRASSEMVLIEAGRRLQELTPSFDIRVQPHANNESCFHLFVGLVKPAAIRRLSSLTIAIRDDRPGRAAEAASFVGRIATAAEIERQVWGPVRLTPRLTFGGGQVDHFGRSITITDGLAVGEVVQLQLELTSPPPWTGSDAAEARRWWDDTVGNQLQLTVEASADEGDASWVIPEEIDISSARGDVQIW